MFSSLESEEFFKNLEIVSKRRYLISLRAKIKGFQKESQILLRKINKTSGLNRHTLRETRKWLGIDTRYYLLAYGFLRGVSYKEIEQNCGPNNKPNATGIFKIIKEHSSYIECQKWSVQKITELISQE